MRVALIGSVATACGSGDSDSRRQNLLTPGDVPAGDTPSGEAGAAGAAGENPPEPTGEARWVGTWSTGPQLTEPGNLPPAPGLSGNTLRQNVLPTLDGVRARLLLSNEWGDAPVTFESVRLASSVGASAIDPSTDRQLLFGGSGSVTIPAGQTQVSDPIDFRVTALSPLSVSIHFGAVPRRTCRPVTPPRSRA